MNYSFFLFSFLASSNFIRKIQKIKKSKIKIIKIKKQPGTQAPSPPLPSSEPSSSVSLDTIVANYLNVGLSADRPNRVLSPSYDQPVRCFIYNNDKKKAFPFLIVRLSRQTKSSLFRIETYLANPDFSINEKAPVSFFFFFFYKFGIGKNLISLAHPFFLFQTEDILLD